MLSFLSSFSFSPLAVQLPVLSFGGCSACTGRYIRHSHGRAAIRSCSPKVSSCLCLALFYRLSSHSYHQRQQSGVDAMRKNISVWRNAFLCDLVARQATLPTAAQQSYVPTSDHYYCPRLSTVYVHLSPTCHTLIPHLFQLSSSLAICSLSQQQTRYSTGAAADCCSTRLIVLSSVCLCRSTCVRA